MGSMEPATQQLSAQVLVGLLLALVLLPLVFVVSSAYPVGPLAVKTTPTPSSRHTLPAQTRIPAPTHTASPAQTSVSSGLTMILWS